MKIRLWNKIDDINGVSATEILESRNDLRRSEEVLLFCDDLDESIIRQIEIPSVLKSNYNLQGVTALEIGQAYLEYLSQEKTEIETLYENVKSLGEQLAQEKLKNIQKDATISQLGQEIASIKLELINIKGGI